jgi:hypothetical protein
MGCLSGSCLKAALQLPPSFVHQELERPVRPIQNQPATNRKSIAEGRSASIGVNRAAVN